MGCGAKKSAIIILITEKVVQEGNHYSLKVQEKEPSQNKKDSPNFGFRSILISKSPIDLYAVHN
jgi:hypothetical protein